MADLINTLAKVSTYIRIHMIHNTIPLKNWTKKYTQFDPKNTNAQKVHQRVKGAH